MKLLLENVREHLEIYLDGNLKGEIVSGAMATDENLEERVRRAHCLMALRRGVGKLVALASEPASITCHRVTKPTEALDEMGAGLVAGVITSRGTIPGVPPKHTKAYRAGYDIGQLLLSAIASGGDL